MEYPLPPRRLSVLGIIVAVLIGILVVRLWQVQVLQGGHYLRLSEENRIRDYIITAPRGIIYDRKGRPLVTNRPSFTVAVLPLELRDAPTILPRLARFLGMTPEAIRARIEANRARPFEPVRVKRDVGTQVVATIEENRLDLPGVIILAEPVRHYLHGEMTAHIMGHLGEIDEAELRARRAEGYKLGDLIGKAGVERTYEGVLRGTDGRLRTEVDALGRPLRVLSRSPAVPGRSIALTVDLDLQKAAYDALVAEHHPGAVIAMDPHTGDVLAMAGIPSYDPNLFAIGIGVRDWQALTADPQRPLLNRAIAAGYEPGSVFKLVTAAAALEEGIVTRSTIFNAPGYFRLGQWTFGDLKAWGRVTFITGIANSINVVFYTLGRQLGGETLAHYATWMGLGEPTGIDLPGEIAGTIPSPSNKQQLVGEPWYPGDSVNMSIGQGAVIATPIQVARMVAGIANGGDLLQPRLLLVAYDKNNAPHRSPSVMQRHIDYQPQTLAVLYEGMRAVVERGSGRAAAVEGVAIAGKTGSAENPRGKPHAWFAGFAPAHAPRLLVVAFIEHGFRGGIAAAPVVRQVFEAAFPRGSGPEAGP